MSPARLALSLTLAGWIPTVPAIELASQDLTALRLEDLMNIEVTSVSRRSEPLLQAPAAVFVLTHERLDPAAKNGTVFTFVDGSPAQVLALARAAAGDRGIAVMGSPDVAQQFLREGLVDVLLLTVVPVLLGAGTPLFAALPAPLELRQTLAVPGSEVALARYEVVRGPAASDTTGAASAADRPTASVS